MPYLADGVALVHVDATLHTDHFLIPDMPKYHLAFVAWGWGRDKEMIMNWTILFFHFQCFTSYLVFSIVVLPHCPGVVYYHLLLRQETRIPGVAPFSFRIGIWDLVVQRGTEILYPHSLWEIVDHSRSKMQCLIIIYDPGMRLGPESNRRPLDLQMSALPQS